MWLRRLMIACVAGSLICMSAWASEPLEATGGLRLGASRIVIEKGARKGALEVTNLEKTPVIVVAKLSNTDSSDATALRLMPSAFKLNSLEKGAVRMVLTQALPEDRESVFWLGVTAVPPREKTQGNRVALMLTHSIKVYYRPKNLDGNFLSAAQGLKWTYKNGVLTAKNDGPISVQFHDVLLNGHIVGQTDLLMPFAQKSWKVPDAPAKVQRLRFSFINEFSGRIYLEVTPLSDGTLL